MSHAYTTPYGKTPRLTVFPLGLYLDECLSLAHNLDDLSNIAPRLHKELQFLPQQAHYPNTSRVSPHPLLPDPKRVPLALRAFLCASRRRRFCVRSLIVSSVASILAW